MSGDIFQALEKFWDPLYRQEKAPIQEGRKGAYFTFLEILTCRTKTDVGFEINEPKLVQPNHQTFCSILGVGQCVICTSFL